MIRVEHERDMAIAGHNRIALEVEALRAADRAHRAGGKLARALRAWRI